jgi:hypothetical protein
MNKVFKYRLPSFNSVQDHWHEMTIQTHGKPKPLMIGEQGGDHFLWAQVNPSANLEDFTFYCIGTGHGIVPVNCVHFASVIDGPHVWHLYILTGSVN